MCQLFAKVALKGIWDCRVCHGSVRSEKGVPMSDLSGICISHFVSARMIIRDGWLAMGSDKTIGLGTLAYFSKWYIGWTWTDWGVKCLNLQRMPSVIFSNPGIALLQACGMQCHFKLWTYVDILCPNIYLQVITHGVLENGPFAGDFPINTSIHRGFSVAIFDYPRVSNR